MLKNHWNRLKTCSFGEITEQPVSNFEGWGLNLVAYKKRVVKLIHKRRWSVLESYESHH